MTLGDFTVKKAKMGREICILLKIDLVESKCAVLQIITIICVTQVQNIFKIRALIRRLLTKDQIFTIAPNFIFSQIS